MTTRILAGKSKLSHTVSGRNRPFNKRDVGEPVILHVLLQERKIAFRWLKRDNTALPGLF